MVALRRKGIKMKLSVWSSYFVDLSPEDALRELKSHGYRHCELSDEHALVLQGRGDPRYVGSAFGSFAAALGVELLQGHLFLGAKICKPEDREILKRELTLFDAIGIKNAVLHCDNFTRDGEDVGIEYKREENLKGLRELVSHIEGTDVTICLENLRPPRFTQSADDLLYFINEIGDEHLGICLDTGHLNLSPYKDQVEFINKAGKHLKALHLADNDGLGKDQHLMPFGIGVVDMEAVIRATKAIGYEGLYNLEIGGDRHAPMEILGYKLDYIKKVFEYLDRVTEA